MLPSTQLHRRWALYQSIAWLVLAGVYTVQGVAHGSQRLWPTFLVTVVGFLPCMIFTPLIAAVAYRFPFADGRLRAAVAHAVMLVLFLVLGGAMMGGFEWALPGVLDDVTIGAAMSGAIGRYLSINFVLYVAVVMAALMLEFGRESRERAVGAARLQAQLAEAQLHALSAQLHPHFLFNTLHAISALVRHDPKRAEQLIARLSELLREMLDGGDRVEIPLREELRFLEKYVDIQEARFGPRLNVVFSVDPGAFDAAVPRLILQPLVENAIRHGVARHRTPVTVEVRAACASGRLTLTVSDDGVGLPIGGPPREGVGLSTTRARMKQLYGTAGGFTIEPGGSCGTVCTILLPCATQGAASRVVAAISRDQGVTSP